MTLSSLIPQQYRYAAIAGALFALMAVSFAAGWNVSSWRSDALNATDLRMVEGKLAAARLRISELDGRNLALDAQARASEAARNLAEQRLQAAERTRITRVERVKTMKASGCDDAIGQYWEMRK